ncbi:hypothetical protein D1007_15249 [Hordeum vulgare]|nr:hypothetical protein D1007_15249 [Hordeum vulgare]
MGPSNLSRSALVQVPYRDLPILAPLPDRCCSSSPTTRRSNAVPGRDLAMSSSASASCCSWPCYGVVPMTRFPACPRTAPLKQLVTTTDKNGNLGREFVKCESKQEQGKGSSFRFQKLKQRAHFEWLDEYIQRIQLEGASRELDLPLEAEKFGSGLSGSGDPGSGNSIGATVGDAAGKAELKKLNKQMKKQIELKKQGNLMAGIFYVCVIALAFVYVIIICH